MARTHFPGSHRYIDDAWTRFPHHVDIPVPAFGFGSSPSDMLIWCVEHLEADTWAQHSWSQRCKGKATLDYARFYFGTTANADAFKAALTST